MSKQREIAITGHPLYNSFVYNKVIETNGVINLKAHPFEEESRSSRGLYFFSLPFNYELTNYIAPVDLIAVIDISGM
jgi:hypothetical protein